MNKSILSGNIGSAGSVMDNSYEVLRAEGAGGAVLNGLTISDGFRSESSGGSTRFGSALHIVAGSPVTVEKCVIENNRAYESGALHIQEDSTIRNTWFRNNVAQRRGGAVQCYSSNSTFENCIFSGNSCLDGRGDAMRLYHQFTTVENCTFYDNFSAQGNNMYISNGGTLIVRNCIVWDTGLHGGGIWVKSNTSNPGPENYASGATVTFPDVGGGFNPPELGSGSDNIDEDPLFEDPGAGDFHIPKISPASTREPAQAHPATISTGATVRMVPVTTWGPTNFEITLMIRTR